MKVSLFIEEWTFLYEPKDLPDWSVLKSSTAKLNVYYWRLNTTNYAYPIERSQSNVFELRVKMDPQATDGAPYTLLKTGTVVRSSTSTSYVSFSIEPSDTASWPAGLYFYEVTFREYTGNVAKSVGKLFLKEDLE